MQDKIIVTGGCGYIGSHTVITLINHNYEVVIFDDLSNSNVQILDRIEKITGARPHFEQVDLKSFEATQAVFKIHRDAKAVIPFCSPQGSGRIHSKSVDVLSKQSFFIN